MFNYGNELINLLFCFIDQSCEYINVSGCQNLIIMPESDQEKEAKILSNELADAMPLDYSFKKIKSLEEPRNDKPREGRVKTPIRGARRGFITKSMWLDNNCLASIKGINQFINSMLEVPAMLSWVDFSFNNIKDIDDEITIFKNLVIIYLHGNAIDNIDTTFKLRLLPRLKRLTLQGNPICETPNYRNIMLNVIPSLKNLDFSAIVKRERHTSMPPAIRKKLQALE